MTKWMLALMAVLGLVFVAPQAEAHPKHGKKNYVVVKEVPVYKVVHVNGKRYYHRSGHYYKKHKGRYVVVAKPVRPVKVHVFSPKPLLTINLNL